MKASLLEGRSTNGRNVTLQKVKLARECSNGVDARGIASFENSKNLSEDLASQFDHVDLWRAVTKVTV